MNHLLTKEIFWCRGAPAEFLQTPLDGRGMEHQGGDSDRRGRQPDAPGVSRMRAVVSVAGSSWQAQACLALCSAAPRRHRKRREDKDRRRHQRCRQGRRGACSEISEFFSSHGVRLKFAIRTHRQRPAQKYAVTRHHDMSSRAVFDWLLGLGRSALTHEGDTVVLTEAETNLFSCVAFWSYVKFAQCRHGPLAIRDPCADGSLTARTQGIRRSAPSTQGPSNTERSLSKTTHGGPA